MSRRKKRIDELAKTERITLEQGYKYGGAADFRQRCQMLLLSEKGYGVDQIVDIVGVCSKTVYNTINAWQTVGIAGLIRKKGQGRKATLRVDNDQHTTALRKAVHQHAQSSRAILQELYAELAIAPISKRSLQRFLKKVATAGSDLEGG